MDVWAHASSLFTPYYVGLMAVATLGGILVGLLPGITVTMSVGLLVGLTFGMPALDALIVLTCVFVGGLYGGSQSAILINVPGSPAAAATALEGHVMCKTGRAGQAIGFSTISSALGTIFGALVLFAVAPLVAEFALKFSAWEYFLLAVVGMAISAALCGRSMALGLMGAFLGVLVALVGMDSVWGYQRFTYGYTDLAAGFAFIPAMIGLFGLAEVLHALSHRGGKPLAEKVGRVATRFGEYWRYRMAILRANVIGVVIGALPGVGADIAAWVSYGSNKQLSREKDQYGKGTPEGVVSAETANNAAIGGTYIPMLTLGIPGDAVTAVILGGMVLHGLRPGPMFFLESPQYFTIIPTIMVMAAIFLAIFGLMMARVTPRVLGVPAWVLFPVVVLLAIVGAFAVNNRIFDVWVMFAFGLLGWGMRALSIPTPPLVLGMILGPMADAEFRRALSASHGSLEPLYTRPLSLALILVLVVTVAASTGLLGRLFRTRRQGRAPAE
ncbi:tripartite tricarboxylate transporter permease [Roseococcus microcysteis]|uniref:tripartite tricarboxylate transporter permease n=1 Tax=Roseococcus microcysteis TaxID=2771361 RepID=UPI00168AA201|nr:tripartite tricarboxylate transporter permease [Roseococcus microcysteis]